MIQRGALDGMAAVVPYGDPALTGLRGEIVPPAPGQQDGLLDLGGFYRAAPVAGAICTRCTRPARRLPVHAVAGPTRVRSHFEAQDCLESGADHRMTSGWLNRAVAAMPADRTAVDRTATRSPSASPCRCCCAARRRGRQLGARTASPRRRPTYTARSPR